MFIIIIYPCFYTTVHLNTNVSKFEISFSLTKSTLISFSFLIFIKTLLSYNKYNIIPHFWNFLLSSTSKLNQVRFNMSFVIEKCWEPLMPYASFNSKLEITGDDSSTF